MWTDCLHLITDAVPLFVAVFVSWGFDQLVDILAQAVPNEAWGRTFHGLATLVDIVVMVTLVAPKALEALQTIIELAGDVGAAAGAAWQRTRRAWRVSEEKGS